MNKTSEILCRLAAITCGVVIQTLYIVIAANTLGKVRQDYVEYANANRDQFLEICEELKAVER